MSMSGNAVVQDARVYEADPREVRRVDDPRELVIDVNDPEIVPVPGMRSSAALMLGWAIFGNIVGLTVVYIAKPRSGWAYLLGAAVGGGLAARLGPELTRRTGIGA